MKKIFVLFLGLTLSCTSNEPEIDTVYPEIFLSGGFPTSCSIMERGQTYTFKARFADNNELGSYSFDFHDNFNHHTHGTSEEQCTLDPKKDGVKPLNLIKVMTLPDGLKEYTASDVFEIPSDVDTGDYHFTIKVTDKAGWQTIERMSVKIK